MSDLIVRGLTSGGRLIASVSGGVIGESSLMPSVGLVTASAVDALESLMDPAGVMGPMSENELIAPKGLGGEPSDDTSSLSESFGGLTCSCGGG